MNASLMRIEHAAAQAAGLKQGEAQQHGVADACPDGLDHIVIHGDALHQHGIHRHTHDDEEGLKAQGEQASQVVLPGLAPFPVAQGCHGDGRDGCDQ